jgi:hypothetical protein
MYSRQEASQLRQAFWTKFGQYMSPVLSAEGERINWINYKTGEKHIQLKMDADNKSASIAIELSHPDDLIREIFYQQFISLRRVFEKVMGEEWQWQAVDTDSNGRRISRISLKQSGQSILKQEDWPALISFFKPRLIALDAFWSEVKYGFEALR